jgi:hypothetical protein
MVDTHIYGMEEALPLIYHPSLQVLLILQLLEHLFLHHMVVTAVAELAVAELAVAVAAELVRS